MPLNPFKGKRELSPSCTLCQGALIFWSLRSSSGLGENMKFWWSARTTWLVLHSKPSKGALIISRTHRGLSFCFSRACVWVLSCFVCVPRQGKESGIKSCPYETQTWALLALKGEFRFSSLLLLLLGIWALIGWFTSVLQTGTFSFLAPGKLQCFAIGDISGQGLQVTLNVPGWGEWALYQV